MKKLFISALAIAATAIIVPVSQHSTAIGADAIPDFSTLLTDCAANGRAKPCYTPTAEIPIRVLHTWVNAQTA